MVNWIVLIIIVGFASQYIIHILDYPRRRYNRTLQIMVSMRKPEPMWFEIITTANQILVCGGTVILFLYFLINMLPI